MALWQARIEETYGVDASDFEDGNLVKVFERVSGIGSIFPTMPCRKNPGILARQVKVGLQQMERHPVREGWLFCLL